MLAPQSQFSEQQDDTLQMSTKLRKMVRFDLNGSFRMVSRVSFFCMVHHFRHVSWERHGGKFMHSCFMCMPVRNNEKNMRNEIIVKRCEEYLL